MRHSDSSKIIQVSRTILDDELVGIKDLIRKELGDESELLVRSSGKFREIKILLPVVFLAPTNLRGVNEAGEDL